MAADSRNQRRVRVAVLFGGQSDEHDVSLRSAQTVIGALDDQKFETVAIGITRDGQWLVGGDPMAQLASASPLFALAGPSEPGVEQHDLVTTNAPHSLPMGFGGEIDVVFPVLHGPRGEDGTVQGLFELAGIPYVGSSVLGSALAMDKAMSKVVLDQLGIPQGKWMLVLKRDWQADSAGVAAQIGELLGYPCFVKPANMGSSVGVSKVHEPGELAEAMDIAGRYDRRIVVEKGLNARELEVSVLGNDDPVASVVGEVIPINEFYDYNAKYIDDRSQLVVPADLPQTAVDQIRELAVIAFRALDLAGLARVDFFLERETDRVLLNEINTIPGFTSISMYPRLWEASGVSLPELVERLVMLALARQAERAHSKARP